MTQRIPMPLTFDRETRCGVNGTTEFRYLATAETGERVVTAWMSLPPSSERDMRISAAYALHYLASGSGIRGGSWCDAR